MNSLKILVIEDDLIWQLKLQMMLEQLNIGTIMLASSLAEAQNLLSTQLPDLVIADIVMPDGIVLSLLTKNYKQLPVIYQTGYSQEGFLKKALSMPNIGFLMKPFERFALQATIEVLLSKVRVNTSLPSSSISVIGKHKHRIDLSLEGIYWVKAEGNYSIINTVDQKYVLKRSLRKVCDELTVSFVQIHKSYIVNVNYVERIGEAEVYINRQSIPIGRKYRKVLFEAIRDKY
ncbi:LytR/AlgR family response regulator transcription factor [Spirosoma aerolatum]|uniref:LytR/AlgR family response regulator transcription factor n=1 Tax=Spirosoma aerolatum TaxID=1211326 RepID=UPI0009AC6967|nr:LytTR family DNA-binding domain-containing protein [Spirosoma aerolatum]